MALPLKLPPLEHLYACFTYNPHTGELHWKERPRKHFANARTHSVWNRRYAGIVAGHAFGNRRYVSVDKQLMPAPRGARSPALSLPGRHRHLRSTTLRGHVNNTR